MTRDDLSPDDFSREDIIQGLEDLERRTPPYLAGLFSIAVTRARHNQIPGLIALLDAISDDPSFWAWDEAMQRNERTLN
jgi:hypothetical protein